MRRIVTVVLVCLVAMLVFTGCDEYYSRADVDRAVRDALASYGIDPSNPSAQPQASSLSDTVAQLTEQAAQQPVNPTAGQADDGTIPVEEQVVADFNGVRATYVGWDPGSDGVHANVKLRIENNGSETYTVQSRDDSINDIMVHGRMSDTIPVGKTANTSVRYYLDELEEDGVTDTPTVAEFKLILIPEETDGDSILSNTIRVALPAA